MDILVGGPHASCEAQGAKERSGPVSNPHACGVDSAKSLHRGD